MEGLFLEGSIPRDQCSEVGVWTEKPSKVYLLKFLSGSHCLAGPANICLPDNCSSYSMWIIFLPFAVSTTPPPTATPSFLFSLLLKMILKVRVSTILVNYSISLGLSHVWHSTCACTLGHVRLFVTPWAVARQALLSMGFSRQEYWSGLPCPPPGHLPDPVIEAASFTSPALSGRFFTTSAPWEAPNHVCNVIKLSC